MSTKVTVRLPSDLVAWLDDQVAGGAGSRSALVTNALHRYRRHLNAEQDAEIYRRTGGYPDLAGMHEHPGRAPL